MMGPWMTAGAGSHDVAITLRNFVCSVACHVDHPPHPLALAKSRMPMLAMVTSAGDDGKPWVCARMTPRNAVLFARLQVVVASRDP
jgi:hypothetical protein